MRKCIVRNATFTPDENDKIIYQIPAMCCAKNVKGCPIERNPILADYILMGNKDSLENNSFDSDYCIFIARQLADAVIISPIELLYSVHDGIFRCDAEEAHRICVAQKLNTANNVKCTVKVNLIVSP